MNNKSSAERIIHQVKAIVMNDILQDSFGTTCTLISSQKLGTCFKQVEIAKNRIFTTWFRVSLRTQPSRRNNIFPIIVRQITEHVQIQIPLQADPDSSAASLLRTHTNSHAQ